MAFYDAIVDRALKALMPVIEKKLDELSVKALAMLEAQIPILLEKVLALLPMLAATVGKTVAEQIVAQFSKVLEADPDAPLGLSNVFDLSETIRNALNDSTPEGIHIPDLSAIIGGLFNGFPK